MPYVVKGFEKLSNAQRCQMVLIRDFITTGQVSNHELLKLYQGDGLKDEFAAITKEIEAIFPALSSEIAS
jgi:hypothetical protein